MPPLLERFTMTLYQPGVYGEQLISGGGISYVVVGQAAIAAGVVVVKASTGRLARVLVTTGTTAAQNITFFDNATAGSGNIIGLVPGGATAGQIFDFGFVANNGITIGQNATLAAGSITISFI